MLRWKIAQFFEILWWKRFLKRRDKSEYLLQKKAYWKRFLSKSGIDDIPSDKNILDAGGGPAGIFLIFPGHNVTMCDPLLMQYQQKLTHFSKDDYPYVEFHQSTIEDFSPGCTYGYVFCLNVINHVKDLGAAIRKLIKLTSSDGYLLVSSDCHKYSFLKGIFNLFQFDILHPHQKSAEDYLKIFVNNPEIEFVRRVTIKKELIFDYTLFVFRKR